MPDDSRRTMIFVSVAVVCVAITGILEWARRPSPIEEYGKVGQEFYPGFTDPTLATSLEVRAVDPDSVRSQEFSVARLDNGRWVIPSHHDYPADAVEKLAKTAASIIGISRDAMVTRWAADHAKYGVVDPNQQTLSIDDLEGIGKRITLTGQDDTVLADYIVGKPAETGEGQYYVRKPDEDEVYIAKLDIDLSTKFADWVKTDLLEVDSYDMRELVVNDYSFDELRGTVTQTVTSTLTRDSGSDPWKLADLNEETEQVNEDAVRDTVNTVADLKIVGVRPKSKGLTPDLKVDREALGGPGAQAEFESLQSELLARGFALTAEQNNPENLRLLAREGELYAATDAGLRYRLYFGRAFTGSQEELEIGLSSNSDGEGEDKKEESKQDTEKPEEKTAKETDEPSDADEDADSEGENTKSKPGRYVFVRVEFDKKYLGEEPVKPVEPQEPPELKQAAEQEETAKEEGAKEEAAREADGAEPEAKQETDETGDEGEEAAEEEAAEEEEEDPIAKVREEYEAAKQQYDSDLKDYEQKLKEFNEKVEEGKKKAEEMNRRFAEWYYVIPGESFEKLRLTRANLVEPKEEEEDDNATPDLGVDPAAPGTPPPTTPPVMAPDTTPPAAKTDDAQPPAKEDAAPAKQEEPPAKEDAAPAKQEEPPAKEDAAPAKQETPPAKKEAPPAKQAATN